jgi:hypothetical protein
MPDPPDIPEPTLDQLLATMHVTDRQFVESKDAPWAQREAIIDFHRRQWKEAHTPKPATKSDTAKQLAAIHDLMPSPKPPEPTLGQIIHQLQHPERKSSELKQQPPLPTVPTEPITTRSPLQRPKSHPTPQEKPAVSWHTRFESTKSFFKHLKGILRFLALGLAIGSLSWSWQVLGADEYGVALGLVALFVVFSLVSLYGWVGIPEYPKATKTIKTTLFIGVGLIAVYSAAVIWQKKGEKPWTTLWAAEKPSGSATDNAARMVITDTHFSKETGLPFQKDQQIGVNFVIENQGPSEAHNVHYHVNIGFVRIHGPQQELEADIDVLTKPIYQELNTFIQAGKKGTVVSPNYSSPQYFSAILKSLSESDLAAFEKNQKALCVLARIEYNNTQWYEQCVMFANENMPELLGTGRVTWHLCGSHNDSGIHRPGSLF